MIHKSLLFAAALLPLAGCQMGGTYDPGRQIAYDQQRLAQTIGARIAGPPERCLVTTPTMDIRAIGNALVARSGGRIWVNYPTGDCSDADRGGAILVMQPDPGGLHCQNTSVQVVQNGFPTGSCMLNQWVPYR